MKVRAVSFVFAMAHSHLFITSTAKPTCFLFATHTRHQICNQACPLFSCPSGDKGLGLNFLQCEMWHVGRVFTLRRLQAIVCTCQMLVSCCEVALQWLISKLVDKLIKGLLHSSASLARKEGVDNTQHTAVSQINHAVEDALPYTSIRAMSSSVFHTSPSTQIKLESTLSESAVTRVAHHSCCKAREAFGVTVAFNNSPMLLASLDAGSMVGSTVMESLSGYVRVICGKLTSACLVASPSP